MLQEEVVDKTPAIIEALLAERGAALIRGEKMEASDAPTWIAEDWESAQRTGEPVRPMDDDLLRSAP